MNRQNSPATVGLLHDLLEAWKRHDSDAVMAFVAHDCPLAASAGRAARIVWARQSPVKGW